MQVFEEMYYEFIIQVGIVKPTDKGYFLKIFLIDYLMLYSSAPISNENGIGVLYSVFQFGEGGSHIKACLSKLSNKIKIFPGTAILLLPFSPVCKCLCN